MLFGDCEEYYYSIIDVCRHRAVTENVLKNHQGSVCISDMSKSTALATSLAFSATRPYHNLDTLKPNGEEGKAYYALRNNNLRVAFTLSRGFIPNHEIKQTLINESKIYQHTGHGIDPAIEKKVQLEVHMEKMNFLEGLNYRDTDALIRDFINSMKQVYNAQAETVFYDLQLISASIVESNALTGETLPHPGLGRCTLARFKEGEITLNSISRRETQNKTYVFDFSITDKIDGTYNLSVVRELDKKTTVTLNNLKSLTVDIPATINLEALNDSMDVSVNYRKSVKDFFVEGDKNSGKQLHVDVLNKALMRLARDYSARCTPNMMAEYEMEFYYHNFKDLLNGSANEVKCRERLIIDYMLLKGPTLMVAHNLRDFFNDKRTEPLRQAMLEGLIKSKIDLVKLGEEYAAENKYSEQTTNALAEIEAQCLSLKLTNALEENMSKINYDLPHTSKSRNSEYCITVSI